MLTLYGHIRVTRGRQVSAAYARLRLLYPFCHIFSCSQKLFISQLLVMSLFDYADVVYVPALNHQLNRISNTAYPKFLFPLLLLYS